VGGLSCIGGWRNGWGFGNADSGGGIILVCLFIMDKFMLFFQDAQQYYICTFGNYMTFLINKINVHYK
jgi:hypothetical protein